MFWGKLGDGLTMLTADLRHGSMRVFSKTTHCLTARKHRHDTIIHHHFHHFLVRMFGLRENRMLQKKAGWVEIGNEIRPNSCHATHWIIMASTYLRARTNIWFIYYCQYFEWYCICQIIFYIKFTIQICLILHPSIQLIKNHLEIKTYYLCYIFHNI